MEILVPDGFKLLGPALHLQGIKQGDSLRTFSAASWPPEVAAKVHSCVMVSSVRLHITTTGGTGPGDYFPIPPRVARQQVLEAGVEVGLTVAQCWQAEVWIWPLGRLAE